jgi:hypothetical protein
MQEKDVILLLNLITKNIEIVMVDGWIYDILNNDNMRRELYKYTISNRKECLKYITKDILKDGKDFDLRLKVKNDTIFNDKDVLCIIKLKAISQDSMIYHSKYRFYIIRDDCNIKNSECVKPLKNSNFKKMKVIVKLKKKKLCFKISGQYRTQKKSQIDMSMNIQIFHLNKVFKKDRKPINFTDYYNNNKVEFPRPLIFQENNLLFNKHYTSLAS